MFRLRRPRPLTVYKRLDLDALLNEALDGDDKYAVLLAWSTIGYYAQTAARLQRSMWRRPVPKGWPRKRGASMPIFGNVHFYLICWNTIWRHLELVRDVPRFAHLATVLRGANAKMLRRYKKARDHLEHLHDRLPGRRGNRELRVPNIFGGVHNTTYMFGGEQVEVGPRSLQALRSLLKEAQEALRRDAWERLVSTKPERAQFVFQRLAGDLSTAALTRALTRHYGKAGNAGPASP